MAKIEINASLEELGRTSTFLVNNNIKFSVVNDFGNHSITDAEKLELLIQKFK